MRLGAVIEISPDTGGNLPADLIAEAYRASRSAAIAFVLQQRVARSEVDRVLDPLVAATCGNVHGVLYLDASDQSTVQAAVDRAELVVAATDDFRATCAARGVRSLDWPAARARIATLVDRVPHALYLHPTAGLERAAS